MSGVLARDLVRRASLLASIVLLTVGPLVAEPEPLQMKLAVMPWLTAAPLFIAQDGGHFADEGLDIEIVTMTRLVVAIPALASGNIDVLAAQISPAMINVASRGASIRAVAARAYYGNHGCVSEAYVARTELLESGRLDAPDSLRGLRLGGSRTSAGFYNNIRLLARGGLEAAEVELIHIPTAAKVDAFARGRIDVGHLSEPWLSRALADGAAKIWLSTSELFPGDQYSYLLFGPNLLDADSDRGTRFLRAYLKGVRAYVDGGKSEPNVEILSRRTRHAGEDLRRMCWPTVSLDGVIDVDSLIDFQRWAHQEGLIDAVVPPGKLIDLRFLGALSTSGSR